jgi:CRISPR system Cascade subunit CasA
VIGFDLTNRPWIPVVRGGRRDELGLRDVLAGTQEIDGLAWDDPLQTVAVLRQVLLPVVLDAFGAPRDDEEWASRWGAGRFDGERIAAYLSEHAGRFDLLHPSTPFAQAAGLRTARDETKPVSLLIPRLATGNNVPLFTARTENDPPGLTPAAAARALLAAQCWDTAAIKTGAVDDPRVKAGKTTGNPTGPLGQLGVVIPVGETLFHTLMLNMPVRPQGLRSRDRPQWKAAPAGPQWRERDAVGLLDLLTWQSRRIRLLPEPDSSADDGVSVRRVVLGAGDRLTGPVHNLELHTAWRQVERPRAGEPPVRPVRHQPGRSAWRGLEALLATSTPTSDRVTAPSLLSQLARLQDDGYLPVDLPLHVVTVGVRYGVQSAVIEDVMVDDVPLPVAALAKDSAVQKVVLSVAREAEALRVAANHLGDNLRAAAGAEKLPWDKGQRLGDMLIHSFTPAVRRILAGLQRRPQDAERAQSAWRVVARRLAWEVAEPALANSPPGTFLGRAPEQPFGPRLAVAEASFKRALNNILGRVEPTAA